MRHVLPLSAVLCAALVLPAHADEGMWQPEQLPELSQTLKTRGLKLDPAALANLDGYPMGAIVSLGGCTASFVSGDGLIVTNHHCAYGALQYNSTAEKNLITDGFLARKPSEELQGAPGSRVYVTDRITDVTAAIQQRLQPWMTGLERYNAIEAESKKLVAECEAKAGYHCRVAEFYGGVSYRLVRQLEIRDVRLVYAPADSIGKFGGDVDNWMWPRHTGDFSYLRAYVAPSGAPAEYSPDNVPYRPRQVLRLNEQGLEDGDFVMVAGYPGRTNRYRLAAEVEQSLEWAYPARIKTYEDTLAIIDEAATRDPAVGVKYASRKAGLNNYLKNYRGQIEGLRRADAVAGKRATEKALADWLAGQDDDEHKAWLADIGKLDQAIADDAATRERDLALQLVGSADAYSSALRLVRLAAERAKPDAERDSGYQERDWPRIKASLEQMQRRFDPAVDQRFMVYGLLRYVALPPGQRLKALDAWLDGARDEKAIAARVAKLYAGSKLGNTEDRLRWFDADSKAIAAGNDSLLKLAVALRPELDALREADEARAGDVNAWRTGYMRAMLAWQRANGKPVYPDANSTLRVTFGSVQGVAPRDAVSYAPFTSVAGILEKNTGEEPFNAPQAELDLIRTELAGKRSFDGFGSGKQHTLPVDFLADLDITGGNSGSPALDARGRLVGLAFDGNWESVSGDWVFDPVLNRSIQVDVRYMLWVMHAVDHADNLLREMGVRVPGAN